MAEAPKAPFGGRPNPAARLLAQQQSDRRSANDSFSGDEMLSDSSLSSQRNGRHSVLDAGAPTRSYTDTQIEDAGSPVAGGGEIASSAAELDRVRARDEQMRRTQEQFVGEDPEAGTPRASAPEQPMQATGTSSRGPAASVEEEADDQADEAENEADFQRAQAQDLRRRQVAQAAAQQSPEDEREAKKAMRKKILDYIKISDGALSVETLAVTLLINLAIWNVSGINKYIFKSDMIPDQSLPEDFCCVTCDIIMCFNWLVGPPCFLGPMILLIGGIALIAQQLGLGNLTKLVGH